MNERCEQKVNQTYNYFKIIQMELEETAIIKIVYRWRKFMKKKKLKRMKQLERQAERDRKYPYKSAS